MSDDSNNFLRETRYVVSGKETPGRGRTPGPCPFCYAMPVVMSWHGGGPERRAVSCENDECLVKPMVVGETRRTAIYNWDWRPGLDLPREDAEYETP